MALSLRAQECAKPDPGFLAWEIMKDTWHPTENPGGYVNVGVAENCLMHKELVDHINKQIPLPEKALTYGDGYKTLRTVASQFLTKHLKPVKAIEPSHVMVTNGCTASIEHLSWAFSNPGDVVLLGQPHYGGFVGDLTVRTGAVLTTVAFDGLDPLSLDAVKKYEAKVQQAHAMGKRVAALILCHPHNPLGRSYPRNVIIEFMKLCQRYQIHLISDEIYALSTFENKIDEGIDKTPFESCLSLDTTDIIDPALVHVIWGLSKDFGANGIRQGFIVSQNSPELRNAIVPVALFSSASSLSEYMTANLLADEKWVDAYIRENRRRLALHYEHVVRWAKANDIEYQPGVTATFFLWVNLGQAYRKAHNNVDVSDIDKKVMDVLLRHKVFLASGVQFGSESPGWLRIVFTHPLGYLDEGLRRIVDAIKDQRQVTARL